MGEGYGFVIDASVTKKIKKRKFSDILEYKIILKKFTEYSLNPNSPSKYVRPLQDKFEGLLKFKIPTNDFRIIFSIDDIKRQLIIFDIDLKKTIYD